MVVVLVVVLKKGLHRCAWQGWQLHLGMLFLPPCVDATCLALLASPCRHRTRILLLLLLLLLPLLLLLLLLLQLCLGSPLPGLLCDCLKGLLDVGREVVEHPDGFAAIALQVVLQDTWIALALQLFQICMKVAHGQWGVALDKHLVGALGSLVKVVVAAAANVVVSTAPALLETHRADDGSAALRRAVAAARCLCPSLCSAWSLLLLLLLLPLLIIIIVIICCALPRARRCRAQVAGSGTLFQRLAS